MGMPSVTISSVFGTDEWLIFPKKEREVRKRNVTKTPLYFDQIDQSPQLYQLPINFDGDGSNSHTAVVAMADFLLQNNETDKASAMVSQLTINQKNVYEFGGTRTIVFTVFRSADETAMVW